MKGAWTLWNLLGALVLLVGLGVFFLGSRRPPDRVENPPAPVVRAEAEPEELKALALSDLKRLLGELPPVLRAWVGQFKKGMPAYTVGHTERVRKIDEAEKAFPGLALAGAAYRGVGIPEVVRDGREAVKRLLPAP